MTTQTRPWVHPVGATIEEADALLAQRIPGYAEATLSPLEEIANKVILARTLRGLTQKQVAELCNTSSSAISRLESGEHLPDIVTLDTLARELDFTFELPLKSGPLAELRPRQKKERQAGVSEHSIAPQPMYASHEEGSR